MPAAETNATNGQKMMTNEDAASLKGDIENIRKDIGQLFEDLKKLSKSEADYAGRKANELKGAAIDSAKEKRDDVEDYVREHPLGALAAAAGVGFILAMLVGR